MLGFGTMRLPQTPDKQIDKQTFAEMVELAIDSGVNYFDTAWPYHDGLSEVALGEILSKYPRDSWYIADKFPGHQPAEHYDCEGIFRKQLNKCKVDYFDFYLLHNVGEFSIETYMNPEIGIVDYFVEQKLLGKIKHLGFSSHATPAELERFLDSPFGKEMEFCQIQLNYLDWTLQEAKRKCEILAARGIPVWVMEPLRGGKLATAADPSLAFRWLQRIPEVTVVLSGMSSLPQMEDNIKTFSELKPLTDDETAQLEQIAEGLKDQLPCTGCRYCTEACPMELDIPKLVACLRDLRFQTSFTPTMIIEALPEDKQPSACLGCGACAQMCPQGIDIPSVMTELADLYAKAPKWRDICIEREKAAARLEAMNKQ